MGTECTVCGTLFYDKRHPNRTYCSKDCSFIGRRKNSTCKHCGGSFYDLTKNNKYCSPQCKTDHKTKPTKTCLQCGLTFTPRRPGIVYCGKACLGKSRVIERRNCLCCGIKLTVDHEVAGKYCSRECKAEHRKDRQPSNVCANCGVNFTAIHMDKVTGHYVNRKLRKTCSDKCSLEWYAKTKTERYRKLGESMSGQKHPHWKGGLTSTNRFVYRGLGWVAIAEKVRARDNRVCQLCGKTEDDNGRRLDVHHIIPYHDINNNKKANRLSNLTSLCRSCHSTEEHKLKNQQIVLPFAKLAHSGRKAVRFTDKYTSSRSATA